MTATSGLSSTAPIPIGSERSAALGYTVVGGAGSYALLVDEAGHQPKLLLQRVREAKGAKNLTHLDIETPNVNQEAPSLEGLGATRVEREARSEPGTR